MTTPSSPGNVVLPNPKPTPLLSTAEETAASQVCEVTIKIPFGPPANTGEVGTLGPYRIVKQLGEGGMGAVGGREVGLAFPSFVGSAW